MSQINPFKYFKTSPEIIKLAVMYCIRFPRSLQCVRWYVACGISYRAIDKYAQTIDFLLTHRMTKEAAWLAE